MDFLELSRATFCTPFGGQRNSVDKREVRWKIHGLNTMPIAAPVQSDRMRLQLAKPHSRGCSRPIGHPAFGQRKRLSKPKIETQLTLDGRPGDAPVCRSALQIGKRYMQPAAHYISVLCWQPLLSMYVPHDTSRYDYYLLPWAPPHALT